MSEVCVEVALYNGATLRFAPQMTNAVDPNRDIDRAIEKLDQGYKAVRMWLVMQLPPQDQARYNQEAPPRQCRCPKGAARPEPERRSTGGYKAPPVVHGLPTIRPGHIEP